MISNIAKRRPDLRAIHGTGGGDAVRVAEFFAGIGLARLGLEQAGAKVVWANDLEETKASMYKAHFQDQHDHLVVADISSIRGEQLPDIDLAWASFPCIDLSLAGNRNGLKGEHSSTFWEFTRVLLEMGDRKPGVVAIENVVGFATSHAGADLAAAIRELNAIGYSVDVLTLDARRFVPQSRPRLFLVGSICTPEDARESNIELRPDWLQAPYRGELITHRAKLPSPPALKNAGLGELVDQKGGEWWNEDRVNAFIGSLSEIQSGRLEKLRKERSISFKTAYRRTRNGISRWEIRSDDIAGCLRTARGGSSKQALVRAGNGKIMIRWMTPVEYARLMGAGEYNLHGTRTNQALFGFGDAVCVPVVTWLTDHYLIPLAKQQPKREESEQLALEVVGV